ncbi:MAG: DNA-deoxyinosine glycosylase, partial [Clostridia bacterium]|nr:DNA-deoxyinosine glycosylase [Clostridia bacterium]
MIRQREEHGIAPVYNEHSRILILGSFPSVASRAEGFFYGHPRNRFWRVVAAVFGESVPCTVEEKKQFL